MTDAQLARIEALVNEGPLPYTEAALLVEEAKRLRGILISTTAALDGAVSGHCCRHCPWCNGQMFWGRGYEPDRFGHVDCPAFNPDGSLR